jgi:uncharacterized membrane protein YfcA
VAVAVCLRRPVPVDRRNLRWALAILLGMAGFLGGTALLLGAESHRVAVLGFLFGFFALLAPFLVAAALPSEAEKSRGLGAPFHLMSEAEEEVRKRRERRRFLIMGILSAGVGFYLGLTRDEWGIAAALFLGASLALLGWLGRR